MYASYILGLADIDTLRTGFPQTITITEQYGYMHTCAVVTTSTTYVSTQITSKTLMQTVSNLYL